MMSKQELLNLFDTPEYDPSTSQGMTNRIYLYGYIEGITSRFNDIVLWVAIQRNEEHIWDMGLKDGEGDKYAQEVFHLRRIQIP